MGQPIFDCFDNEYKHPFGALRRGQPSIYNIRLPKTMHVTDLACHVPPGIQGALH